MTFEVKSGHPGGSLSAAEIITALFFYKMRYDPKNPKWPERDRFILSKGHAAPALYAALALSGFFPEEELLTLRKPGSRLQGHPSVSTPGIEICTGSLGQGLSVANGIALAGKIDRNDYHVYVLMGDGEVQEGCVWEAAMSSSQYKLNNVTAIIDRNRIQQTGNTEDIMGLEPLKDKWKAFGWHVMEINGHAFSDIINALNAVSDKPKMIIANTTKGKGVSFMENRAGWHGVAPNQEEFRKALEELR